MDLRHLSLPSTVDASIKHQMANGVTWYQPFVVRDDLILGTAGVWNAGANKYICTKDDTPALREAVLRETLILGEWYDYLNDVILSAFPNAETFMDFGCNLGHFCLDLARRGKDPTGVDVDRNGPGVELLQDLTGYRFEFIGSRYDERRHCLTDFDDARQFDVGILSVVLMHLTDPHYAMPYFASKFKQGFFFSSLLAGGGGHMFKARMARWNHGKPLPDAFELLPTEPLCETLMRLCGFDYIYKIPYRQGIDPKHSQKWGCWIASRTAIPEYTIETFSLELRPDRVSEFADGVPAGAPADTLRNAAKLVTG